ncbi:MAG: agmatinase [Candidatus Marinimicrobia bacterium CG08_land_8_20_14_0_20_45_22]|nr:MAG: agmatinase [Candidatus Marinimicrobia bacterium CG08_land_8_20_14_0_20_45_22]
MTYKCSTGAFCALSEPYCNYDNAKIVILPIPYDDTSTWQKGADEGPEALIDASGYLELYDIETNSMVYKQGIATLEPVVCPKEPKLMVNAVYKTVKGLLKDKKFVVGLGGEHTISIGIVKAMAERYKDLTVLQFDAHSDLRESYHGSRYNHACVMARAHEYAKIVQVGIRSMDISELGIMDKSRVFFAHDFYRTENIIEKIVNLLTDNVYITVDLDVFDPSSFPSTGTPEPGGLGWYDVLKVIQAVAGAKNIVSMDVNELMPSPANRAPDFAAAKLIYRTLSMIFSGEKKNEKK